jgi:hypothetical protein
MGVNNDVLYINRCYACENWGWWGGVHLAAPETFYRTKHYKMPPEEMLINTSVWNQMDKSRLKNFTHGMHDTMWSHDGTILPQRSDKRKHSRHVSSAVVTHKQILQIKECWDLYHIPCFITKHLVCQWNQQIQNSMPFMNSRTLIMQRTCNNKIWEQKPYGGFPCTVLRRNDYL